MFDEFLKRIKDKLSSMNIQLPSVSIIASEYSSPFCILISTLISLRTKDPITLSSSRKLFNIAKTPQEILSLSDQELEEAIYPACFYKIKAQRIKEISKILIQSYNSLVPNKQEELLSLPGVGIKTANLTLNLGFDIKAICVDCHVHQIANRLGWIQTNTPEESEKALQDVIPKKHWIILNEALVSFGQNICTSLSPRCSICSENDTCPKIGVSKSR